MEHVINYDAVAEAIIRRAASKELAVGWKHDASGTPATTGYLHGPNGLLRYPGVDPAVFHTIVQSRGLMSQLQWYSSLYENPLYETITGITDPANNTVKQEVCDDAPGSGFKKGCIVSLPFGWVSRGTREVSAIRVGQRLDRAEPFDLFVVGNAASASLMPGDDGNPLPNDVFINEIANAVSDRNVAMHNDLSRLLYRGDPANNTNGYAEYPGLQIQVGTGHVDALTNTACPSTDSLIFDMDYAKIDDDANALIRRITYGTRYVRDLADRTGVNPVRWVIVMRPLLHYELAQRWPCTYYLGGCGVIDAGTGQRINIDARDMTDLRDQMRQGRFLLIDGMRWEVVYDDSIPEESSNDAPSDVTPGCFASDIYILPMSVLGGRSTLYGEYFQFQNPAVASMFGSGFLGRIDGAFLETPRQKNQCFVLDATVRPRIVLRAPWLAVRIENVQYCPLLHERSPFPDDDYFVDGGVQGARTAPTYHNQWD